jgi:uridine kinase
MNERRVKLIAIVGGSGAGKTWLADRLQQACGAAAGRLSLDDFYRDRSHLSPVRRAAINFDHPRAIDWPLVLQALRACREGRLARLPRYSFTTHTRLHQQEEWLPSSLVLMDGLWLFCRPTVRELFDLRIFLACATQLRLERRLARDVAERGRSAEAVREQFWKTVAPMHDQFVAPQARWADVILTEPPSEEEVQRLVDLVQHLAPRDRSTSARKKPARRWLAWPRTGGGPSFAPPQPMCVFDENPGGCALGNDLIGS